MGVDSSVYSLQKDSLAFTKVDLSGVSTWSQSSFNAPRYR